MKNKVMDSHFETDVKHPAVDSKCLFFHRSGVIMADGEVVTCANMYAANAGRLDKQTSFMDIWNGEAMQSVRACFGTDGEWGQCQSCWFREIKYHSQREAWANQESYSLESGTKFTFKSWDFTDFEEME